MHYAPATLFAAHSPEAFRPRVKALKLVNGFVALSPRARLSG